MWSTRRVTLSTSVSSTPTSPSSLRVSLHWARSSAASRQLSRRWGVNLNHRIDWKISSSISSKIFGIGKRIWDSSTWLCNVTESLERHSKDINRHWSTAWRSRAFAACSASTASWASFETEQVFPLIHPTKVGSTWLDCIVIYSGVDPHWLYLDSQNLINADPGQ